MKLFTQKPECEQNVLIEAIKIVGDVHICANGTEFLAIHTDGTVSRYSRPGLKDLGFRLDAENRVICHPPSLSKEHL